MSEFAVDEPPPFVRLTSHPRAVEAAAGAGSQRSGREGAGEARGRTSEFSCRITCVCSARRGWSSYGAARRTVATATTRSIWLPAAGAYRPPARRCIRRWPRRRREHSGEAFAASASGAVPVHGQQCPVADRRSAARAHVGRDRRRRERRQSSQAAAPQCRPRACGRGESTSAPTAPSISRSSSGSGSTRSSRCATALREVCPPFPSAREQVHWSMPDPSLAASNDRATYPAFEHTAVELETRIAFRLHQFANETTRRSTHAQR